MTKHYKNKPQRCHYVNKPTARGLSGITCLLCLKRMVADPPPEFDLKKIKQQLSRVQRAQTEPMEDAPWWLIP